jgi:hypothetical protein
MGFMDKAKKLAEQAQQKLDEAQNQFNQGAAPQGPQGTGEQRYDEHGRPIQEGPPAGEAPPPTAQPAPAPPDAETPASPSAPAAPAEPPAAAPPPSGGQGDANATPDPFKPLQQ